MTPIDALYLLLDDAERIARSPLVAGVVRNRLLGTVKAYRDLLDEGTVNSAIACEATTDLYWEIDRALNLYSGLVAEFPLVRDQMTDAKEIVKDTTGEFVYRPGGEILKELGIELEDF